MDWNTWHTPFWHISHRLPHSVVTGPVLGAAARVVMWLLSHAVRLCVYLFLFWCSMHLDTHQKFLLIIAELRGSHQSVVRTIYLWFNMSSNTCSWYATLHLINATFFFGVPLVHNVPPMLSMQSRFLCQHNVGTGSLFLLFLHQSNKWKLYMLWNELLSEFWNLNHHCLLKGWW